MSASGIENPPMARLLPPNLVSFFAQALKSYQLSNAKLRVLCSVTPSVVSSAYPPPADSLAPQPPQATPKTLLVLDSSFNPPTLAHQRMALSALSDHRSTGSDKTHVPRVLLLLAINNADKAPKPAAFPQRLAMMYIFARDLLLCPTTSSSSSAPQTPPCTAVDIAVTTEPYFHAKSIAVSESAFYRGQSAEADRMEQVYLTGFDTLIRIFDPKYYPPAAMATSLDPLFARARLRVSTRTDAEWGSTGEQRAHLQALRDGGLERVGGRGEWADRIEMVEGRGEGDAVVSSTKVRDAVQGKDWGKLKKLVSEDVAAWIREEGLYDGGGV